MTFIPTIGFTVADTGDNAMRDRIAKVIFVREPTDRINIEQAVTLADAIVADLGLEVQSFNNCGHTIRCPVCMGSACDEDCGYCDHWNDGPDSHKVCRRCGGRGVVVSGSNVALKKSQKPS